MTDAICTPEQVGNAEWMASIISSAPLDKQFILRVITEALIMGTQISEHCTTEAN